MSFTKYKSVLSQDDFKINNSKALGIFFQRIILLISFQIALYFSFSLESLFLQIPLIILLVFFISFNMVSLFVIGHDCGHYIFHSNRKINNLIGHICMSVLLTGFHNWRISHLFHHTHTNMKEYDPDWPYLMVTKEQYQNLSLINKVIYTLGYRTPLGIMNGFAIGMIKRSFMQTFLPLIKLSSQDKKDLLFSNILMLIISGLIQYSLYIMLGLKGLLFHFWIPAILAMAWGTLLTFLHHTHDGVFLFSKEKYDKSKAQILGTINVRLPRLIEWFFLDINIHIPHHLSMSIPCYHLKQVDKKFEQEFPNEHREEYFNLSHLIDIWKNPFIKQLDDGVFVIQ